MCSCCTPAAVFPRVIQQIHQPLRRLDSKGMRCPVRGLGVSRQPHTPLHTLPSFPAARYTPLFESRSRKPHAKSNFASHLNTCLQLCLLTLFFSLSLSPPWTASTTCLGPVVPPSCHYFMSSSPRLTHAVWDPRSTFHALPLPPSGTIPFPVHAAPVRRLQAA
jgi:hypothetical protein